MNVLELKKEYRSELDEMNRVVLNDEPGMTPDQALGGVIGWKCIQYLALAEEAHGLAGDVESMSWGEIADLEKLLSYVRLVSEEISQIEAVEAGDVE